MAIQNLKVRSGNTIKVLFDGKEVGLLQDIRCSDDYAPEPASGIGDIHVQEYVPTMARHNLTSSEMRLKLRSMSSQGISLENGDEALLGMVFDIEVLSFDGTSLRKYRNCSFASGEMTITKHAIVVANATFNALDVVGKSS
jgi:hypothetical protein